MNRSNWKKNVRLHGPPSGKAVVRKLGAETKHRQLQPIPAPHALPVAQRPASGSTEGASNER